MKKFNVFLTIALIVLFSVTAYAAQYILGTNPTTPTTTTDTTPVFTRTLSLGMTGQDVAALNDILSLDLSINISGDTFTTATQNAVDNFQEKYAVDILIPAGLSASTGVVGATTIAKLNQLAIQYNIQLSDFAPVVTTPTVPQIFTRTLELGDSGDDVLLLKSILNSDPATALVSGGTNESQSNVFDLATEIAVDKFQEKYAAQILTPSGLTQGTGIVGPATIKELNLILKDFSSAIAQQNGATSSANVAPTPINSVNTNTGPAVYSCTTDLYSCSDWSACDATGNQTRVCQITFACQSPTADHSFNMPLSQSCTAPTPAPTTGAGTVATGYVDMCQYLPLNLNPKCTISSGSASCNSNQIVCPSGSSLVANGTSIITAAASSLSSTCVNGDSDGGFSSPQSVSRASYSCVTTGQSSTPAPAPTAAPSATTVATGYVVVNGTNIPSCTITSGGATCTKDPNEFNTQIICPSGSNLVQTGQSETGNPSGTSAGGGTLFTTKQYSCMTGGSSAPSTSSGSCGDAFDCLVNGIVSPLHILFGLF